MKYVFNLFFNLGLHIGTYNYLTLPKSYKYLLGVRNNIAIFDLQQIYYQLRTVNSFLYELGREKAFLLFFNSKIVSLPIYFKLFLLNIVSMQFNHAFVQQKWSYGQLSNSKTQIEMLVSTLFYLDAKGGEYSIIGYSIYDLLYKLLFFTIYKRLEGVSWLDTYNSVRKYWRFFYFFKCYSFSKLLPDALVYINTKNFKVPTLEAESQFVPVVLVGSNAVECYASYVITSNNISYLVGLFYFVLFLYSYNYGLASFYKRITNKSHGSDLVSSFISLMST
jgi:ribosomal protein S2